MNYKRGPSYLVALALVVVATGSGEAMAFSEPRATITAPANTGVANSVPIPERRPPVGWSGQGYLSDFAQCMTDLGWEATYESRVGLLLGEIPFSLKMERERAMSLCVASARPTRGIYAY